MGRELGLEDWVCLEIFRFEWVSGFDLDLGYRDFGLRCLGIGFWV